MKLQPKRKFLPGDVVSIRSGGHRYLMVVTWATRRAVHLHAPPERRSGLMAATVSPRRCEIVAAREQWQEVFRFRVPEAEPERPCGRCRGWL